MRAAANAVRIDTSLDDAEDCRAAEIAADLMRLHGPHALAKAEHRRDTAEAMRKVMRADLYRAVCVIVADRDGVFSRSRGQHPRIGIAVQPIARDAA